MTGHNNQTPFERFVESEYRSDPLSLFAAFERDFSALAERFGFNWSAVRGDLPAAFAGSKRKFKESRFFQSGKNPFKGKSALWVEYKTTRQGLVYPLVTANCFSTGEETVSSLELVWEEFKRTGGKDFANAQKRDQRIREREARQRELAAKQQEAKERAKLDAAIREQLHQYFKDRFDAAPAQDPQHLYLQAKGIAAIASHFDLRNVTGDLAEFNQRLQSAGLPMIREYADRKRYEREFAPCMAFALVDVFGRYVGLQRFYSRKNHKTGASEVVKLQTASVTDHQFKGSMAVIGSLSAERIVVVEGFATGASIFLAAQEVGIEVAVVVAMWADNVKDVLDKLRKVDPKAFARCALFTDNDAWKELDGKGNKGLLNGVDMSYQHKVPVKCPSFDRLPIEQLKRWAKHHRPELVSNDRNAILATAKPTDFNDLHAMGGLQAVLDQIADKRSGQLKASSDYFEYCLQRLAYVPHAMAEDEAYKAIKAGLALAPFKHPSSAELLREVLGALPLGCKIDERRLARRMRGAVKLKTQLARDSGGLGKTERSHEAYRRVKGRMGKNGVRELPRHIAKIVAAHDGITIVRAPKGSGKTANLIGPVMRKSRFGVYIAHRVALINGTAKRLNITDYQDVERANASCVDRLAICVNSIVMEKFQPALQNLDFLAIDEAVQTIRHIATGTVEHRVAVLEKLGELIRDTKHVVLCDADANDMLVEFVKAIAPERQVRVYDMDMDGSPYHTEFGELAQVFETACEKAAAGERVLVATDSQNEGDRMRLRIQELAGEKQPRVLVVHQQSREEDEAVRRFLSNPNEELKKYDTVIYSPTMGTGVSIERQHFNHHYGLFYGVILHFDAMQMLHRDRTAKHFVLGLGYRGGNRVASKEELLLGLLSSAQTDETGEVSIEAVPGEITARLSTTQFDDLKLAVMAMENASRNDFANNLLLFMMSDGYKVTPLAHDEETKERGREAQKATGAQVKKERQERVLAVETPDENEYFRLQMQELKTREDYAKIARYEIANVLCAPAVTLDDVDFLEKGGHRKMAAFEDIRLDRQQLAAYDRWQASKGIASTLRAYRCAGASIRLKVFELLGVDPKTGQGEYTHVEAQNVINWLVEDSARLHRFNYLKIGSPLNAKREPKQPTSFVESILERMGLKSTCRKTKGLKVRGIDADGFEQMSTYFERRQAIGVSSVSIHNQEEPRPNNAAKPAATTGKEVSPAQAMAAAQPAAQGTKNAPDSGRDTSHIYIPSEIEYPLEDLHEIAIEEYLAHTASMISDDDLAGFERTHWMDELDDRPILQPHAIHYGPLSKSESDT